jgi:hypothetical protein
VNVATNDQKNQVIRADDVARAMVDVAVLGTGKRRGPIFENRDIQAIVESPPPRGVIQREVTGRAERLDAVIAEHTALAPHTPFQQAHPKTSKDIRAINSGNS